MDVGEGREIRGEEGASGSNVCVNPAGDVTEHGGHQGAQDSGGPM